MSRVKVAKIISMTFHPFIWISFSLFIIAIKELPSTKNVLFTFLPISLLIIAIPSILLWIFIKKGFASNAYLTDKKEREWFISLTFAILLPVFIACILFLNLPKTIILVMLLIFINIFIYLFLSRFIKISAHIGVVNSIAISLSLLYGINFLLLTLLEIPIAWARYTLKHHSILEMFLAFIITSIITLFVFIVL